MKRISLFIFLFAIITPMNLLAAEYIDCNPIAPGSTFNETTGQCWCRSYGAYGGCTDPKNISTCKVCRDCPTQRGYTVITTTPVQIIYNATDCRAQSSGTTVVDDYGTKLITKQCKWGGDEPPYVGGGQQTTYTGTYDNSCVESTSYTTCKCGYTGTSCGAVPSGSYGTGAGKTGNYQRCPPDSYTGRPVSSSGTPRCGIETCKISCASPNDIETTRGTYTLVGDGRYNGQ